MDSCHETAWDKIHYNPQFGPASQWDFLFKRNGKGTPGHQRIPEAEEMSDELCAYIESLNIQW